MNGELRWKERLTSAPEAVASIRPGEHVFVGTASATPRALVHALENLHDPPSGVELIHFLTDGVVPVYAGGPHTNFRHKVFFVGSDIHGLGRNEKIQYVPVSIAQVYRLVSNGRIPVDVALVQVSPPDSRGFCSLGVSVDITIAAVRRAKRVIAEVNPNMPRTHGDTVIPVNRIDQFVAVDTPVIEYLHEPADDVARKIARYIARLIDDGATLQVGLGRVPNEMLRFLENRQDLGIHSDVITEPLVDLIEAGVVTGARKTLHPHRIVASYCMGSKRLYDLIDDNPMFNFQPIHYVCDPNVIASNYKMVSVSQAFAIDLTGEVCADQFDGRFYSGISTQPEFIRGTAASEGGKAIICLASTTDDGRQSRIRTSLVEGEAATIPRSDVHYVVTEFGFAYLFGRSIEERTLALIEIAHPDFRENLLEEAKRLGYVASHTRLRSRSAYPTDQEREIVLRNDARIRVRPARGTDREKMQELFYSLSPEDVYTRFFTNLRSLSDSKAQHLCSINYEDEMAFVAVTGSDEQERIIGSCCYYLNQSTNLADVAYMIHPDWQGVGLGSTLQSRLIEFARERGLRGFTADILCENARMLRVIEKSGSRITKKVNSGSYEVTMIFGENES